MPVRVCDACHRFYVVDGRTPVAPACPHCASPMRQAAPDELERYLRELADSHGGPEDPPDESSGSGSKGGWVTSAAIRAGRSRR
jgi:hypothetical protein